MSVVVFGSINMDLVVRTPRLPRPGETLTGHSFSTHGGGKGANQAVACARLGATTNMVGRVGNDVFGATLQEDLQSYGVDISNVTTDTATSSGIAVIAVDDSAENTIIVVPGANGLVGTDDVARLGSILPGASVLLLQLEVPIAAVVGAAAAARDAGVAVVLDPAPAQPLPAELYAVTDIITPNETEAAALVGFPIDDVAAAERAAQVLLERGARRVIIKMGSKGAYAHDGSQGQFLPAMRVTAVDTVAAGDAFNGALATALDGGLPFFEAVSWGLAGGALSVTKPGAQSSMPDRDALSAMLAE